MDSDIYQTIQRSAVAELKIKGSRFIGRVQPVQEREQAEAALAVIRKNDYDATHHCYAYRLGIGSREISRFSDDGEPSGSAGRPILLSLTAGDLTDVLLVVTRYFGGVKLGTGGLARAYSRAAVDVLAQAGRREVWLMEKLELLLPYELYGLAQNQTEKYAGKIEHVDYGESVTMHVLIRKSQVDAFQLQIIEQSNAKIKTRSGS
jgi:uncharacterized YigZ family protein